MGLVTKEKTLNNTLFGSADHNGFVGLLSKSETYMDLSSSDLIKGKVCS